MSDTESMHELVRRLEQLERDVLRIASRLGEIERAIHPPLAKAAPPVQPKPPAAMPMHPTPPAPPLVEVGSFAVEKPKPWVPAESGLPGGAQPFPAEALADQAPVAKEPTPQPVPDAFISPPPPPPRRPPPGPPPEPAWMDLLRRVNMLPPERGRSVEAELGTWWLTRIGALILVIGVVFFGVYVSAFSTPPVRLAEVIGAALGLAALGLWLERGNRQFGAVLIGSGLALLFFAAFGAYALPPLKVIDSAARGAAWQFAAAAAIAALALARGSVTIATMATLCGYAACFFSFTEDFHDFALVAAWLLGAGAAGLSLRRGWAIPYRCAVPLAYFIYFCIVAIGWHEQDARPGFVRAEAFPLAAMILFIGADYAALVGGRLPGYWIRRIVMLCNTTGAVGLGLLATWLYYSDHYAAFYFTFGATLLAAAAIYWRTAPLDGMVYLFYIKGSALISMGLISHFKARTRWLALAAQSLVLLLSARRSHQKRLLETVATATWLVSLWYFMTGMGAIAQLTLEGRPFYSPTGLAAIGYVLFSAWLMGAQGRWMATEAEKSLTPGALSGHQIRIGLLSLLVGVAGIHLIGNLVRTPHQSLGLILLTAAIAATVLAGRYWVAGVAAIPTLLAAHVVFRMQYRLMEWPQLAPKVKWDRETLLHNLAINGPLLIGLTLAGAVALDEWLARRKGEAAHRAAAPAVAALHALWIFALLTALFDSTPHGFFLLAAVALAAGLAAAATRLRHLYLADLAALPLIFAIGDLTLRRYFWFDWPAMVRRLGEPGATLWLGPAAALGAFGFAALCRAWPAVRGRFVLPARADFHQWLHVALAGAIGLAVMQAQLDGRGIERYWFTPLAALAGLAVALLARWPGVRPALWCGAVYVCMGHALFLVTTQPYRGPDNATFLWLALVAAALTLALALAARRLRPDLIGQTRATVEGLLGALAMLMLLVLFGRQRGDLTTYATVFWGLSAVAIFVAGLAGRSKPLRIVSLAGLALCIVRIFLVDAQSTLDRIFAFIGVGVVLMAVGFLYYKYRDRIGRLDQA